MTPFQNALAALGITVALFGTVVFAVDYLNEQRIAELSRIEDTITIDTLSLETQFDLLAEAPCREVSEGSVLSGELNDLAARLSYAEERLGADNEEVTKLKERYTLLEIKDYLLMKRLAKECTNLKPVFVLYFYSNKGDCPGCAEAGYALSYLREKYPELRVYAFDYNLDLGALKTLRSVLRITEPLPAFVINGKNYSGITSLGDLEPLLPTDLLATSTDARRR
ncbi:hypothetical protein KGO06_01490 [Patescibacteria group bacterium]|nr:hypothetical protein [Patescibacteria group bacterium]